MTPSKNTQDEINSKLELTGSQLGKLTSPTHQIEMPRQDHEIDLLDLWRVVWQGKWLVIAMCAIFSASAVWFSLSLPNIYQSEALLAPSDETQGGGISRMAGQLGGLASLAGINLGAGAGGNKVAIAMEVLQSRKFLSDFVDRHKILPELMAIESWSRLNNELVYDKDLYDSKADKWVRVVDPPRQPEPSSWEAYKTFRKILNVSQAKDSGFVKVAVEHQSPYIAQQWTDLLVRDVNTVMKAKDMEEANRSIEFLQAELVGVSVADMRTVFYQLIEEQMKTMMLAQVREEYIFTTIDPPVVAEEKSGPKRTLICLIGFFLGLATGVFLVLVRRFIKK